jgi:hypothetical protein
VLQPEFFGPGLARCIRQNILVSRHKYNLLFMPNAPAQKV